REHYAAPQLLFHRRWAVQDDCVDGAAVPELGLERRVRAHRGGARRHARSPLSDDVDVVHRVCGGYRPDCLRLDPADVCRRVEGSVDLVRVGRLEKTHMRSEPNRILLAATLAASVVAGIAPSLQARGDESKDKKVKEAASQSAKAAKAFEAIMQEPDKAIPADVLSQAKAIMVFPQVVKVAFAVGGEGGRGVVSRHVNGGWSRPIFVRGGGPSGGAQNGASSTDFFMLLLNHDSVHGPMKDNFQLRAEVTPGAGPVGKYHGSGTDATMQAEILTYSRSHGLFAGANVKGIVIRPENDLNTAVYNKTARELLTDDGVSTDAQLGAFPQTLSR